MDILGDAEPERYAKSLEIASKDPNIDGMLVIMTPQAMTESRRHRRTAQALRQGTGKPVLASWMGGESVAKGEAHSEPGGNSQLLLSRYRRASLQLHVALAYNLRGLYETPSPNAAAFQPNRARASEILSAVRNSRPYHSHRV